MIKSTTGSSIYRKCGGKEVYCDGVCTNCRYAEIVYSNRNETTNSSTIIHIVRRPV